MDLTVSQKYSMLTYSNNKLDHDCIFLESTDRLAGWSPGRLPARARCLSVYVYKINASNAMPKPYLTVYIRMYARTYSHAVDHEKYSQANARECK